MDFKRPEFERSLPPKDHVMSDEHKYSNKPASLKMTWGDAS